MMKADLDGLAANIKGAIAGPQHKLWRFMVDEMVREIRRLEGILDHVRLTDRLHAEDDYERSLMAEQPQGD
jgi:hypothetical protein